MKTAKIKVKLEQMDKEFKEKFILLEEKIRFLLAGDDFQVKRVLTDFGTEFHLYCNLIPSEIDELTKTLGLPKFYGEHSLAKFLGELGGKDTSKLLKYWYMWGVRAEYTKDTNGFKSVKEWLNNK